MFMTALIALASLLTQSSYGTIAPEEPAFDLTLMKSSGSDKFFSNSQIDVLLHNSKLSDVTPEMLHVLLPPDGNLPIKTFGQTHVSIRQEQAHIERTYQGGNARTPMEFKVDITVFPTPKDALSNFEALFAPSRTAASLAVPYKNMALRGRSFPLPIGIGDDCWQEGTQGATGYVFVRGRCFVQTKFSNLGRVAEALCRSIDYRILQNPLLSCEGEALTYKFIGGFPIDTTVQDGLEMVAVHDLTALGAKVGYSEVAGYPHVQVSTEAGRFDLGAFGSIAVVDDNPTRFEVPCFTCNGDIVVPLKPALVAIGIK